jgi:hypothetical protein
MGVLLFLVAKGSRDVWKTRILEGFSATHVENATIFGLFAAFPLAFSRCVGYSPERPEFFPQIHRRNTGAASTPR